MLHARHVPGLDNGLADALSRWVPGKDTADWQVHPAIFDHLEAQYGPFDVDAMCDPVGANAFVAKFWSSLDSCFTHDWAGMNVYCNPDLLRSDHADSRPLAGGSRA